MKRIICVILLLILISPISACIVDMDNSHLVKIQFIEENNTPIDGFVITHQQIYDDPIFAWVLGYMPQEHDTIIKKHALYNIQITDTGGYVTKTLYPYMIYNITFDNRTTNERYTFRLYPKESEYIFFVNRSLIETK